MDDLKVTPLQLQISEILKWLVGRTLDYIDIAVDSIASTGDRYPKKDRLKKLFEQEIYGVRNEMFAMDRESILEKASEMFAALEEKLNKFVVISIVDKDQRIEFIALVNQKVVETRTRLLQEL